MRSCLPLVRAGWARSNARDNKLGRDVAIKILLEQLVADEREAQLLPR